MNPMRTILVDDEIKSITILEMLLKDCKIPIEIIATFQDPQEAAVRIKSLNPQLVLLDITMPGLNGIELLREMGNVSFEVIFVTAHEKYMPEAFRFSAVDYLVKPVEEELLFEAVERAWQRIEQKAGNKPVQTLLANGNGISKKMKICLPSIKGFQIENIQDILYCESRNNYTYIHMNDTREVCSSRPIGEYELLLEDSGFLRVHKSFLVNLEYVKEYNRTDGGTIKLANEMVLEVSRRKKDVLLAAMKEIFKF